jgi:C-terminal processing protease CtpA/Prc
MMGVIRIGDPRRLLGAGLLALASASGCAQAQPTLEPVSGPDLDLQKRTVEALWTAVDEHYLYEDSNDPAWAQTRDDYLARLDDSLGFDEFDALLNDMVNELPQDAPELVTREERIRLMMDDPTPAPGVIGAYVMYGSNDNSRVMLTMIIPDSPAESAGLQAHDSILAVDGTPISNLDGPAVDYIRGPVGENVSLLVESPDESAREVIVTRGEAISTSVGARVILTVLDGSIIHILMPPVTTVNNVGELANALIDLDIQSHEGIQGFILDLRLSDSSSWDFDTLEGMMTLFGDGNLGSFYTRLDVSPIEIDGQDVGGSQRLPLAIIVGEETVGLPEVLSASLQATGRAVVVGPQTSGGVEFSITEVLPNGTRMLIPAIGYRTPDGEEIGRDGIVPDVQVNQKWYQVTEDDDPVLAAAYEAVTTGIVHE